MASPRQHEQHPPTGLEMASKEWELAHREAERSRCAQVEAGRTSGRIQAACLHAAETHRRARALHERIAALHVSSHLLQQRRSGPPAVGLLADPGEHDVRL